MKEKQIGEEQDCCKEIDENDRQVVAMIQKFFVHQHQTGNPGNYQTRDNSTHMKREAHLMKQNFIMNWKEAIKNSATIIASQHRTAVFETSR